MVFVPSGHPGIFVDSAVEAAAMFRSDAEMIARPAQRSVGFGKASINDYQCILVSIHFNSLSWFTLWLFDIAMENCP